VLTEATPNHPEFQALKDTADGCEDPFGRERVKSVTGTILAYWWW